MTSRNFTSPYELNGRIPLAQASATSGFPFCKTRCSLPAS